MAVSDTPAGEYTFYGRVHYEDGTLMAENQPYDPALVCTKDGNFLYFGFAPCMINIKRYKGQDLRGGSVLKLADDMLTVLEGPKIVIPSKLYGKGTSFEGNEYFEGPSIRYIRDKYYLVYSSVNTHQLCYAISEKPMEGFEFAGVIVSNGDVGYKGRKEEKKVASVGNNHGGLVCVEGQWYIFYHRHTYLNQYNRQGCAERVYFTEDGRIPQVTITSSGMNPGPLSGNATYPAVYCCNLTNGHMGALSSLGRTNAEIDFPYITCENGERFVTNVKDGDLIGYKYINLAETKKISVSYRSEEEGCLEIHTEKGKCSEVLALHQADEWTWTACETSFTDEKELYLIYKGTGKISLLDLKLEA